MDCGRLSLRVLDCPLRSNLDANKTNDASLFSCISLLIGDTTFRFTGLEVVTMPLTLTKNICGIDANPCKV